MWCRTVKYTIKKLSEKALGTGFIGEILLCAWTWSARWVNQLIVQQIMFTEMWSTFCAALYCNIAQKFVRQQECEQCRCDVNGIPCRHYKLCDTGVPVFATLIPFLDLTTQLYTSWQLPAHVMDNRSTQGHVSLVSRTRLGVLKWRVVQLQCIACQYMYSHNIRV